MLSLDSIVRRISSFLNILAAASLVFMMMLTVFDVGFRAAGYPFVGAYEVVALSLALVIGLSIPKVTLDGAHVYMEIVLDRLSVVGKKVMSTFTRLLCICLFIFIGINLFSVGAEFRMSGEVSQTLQLPFFPIAYAVGVCAFLECFVFLISIANLWRK